MKYSLFIAILLLPMLSITSASNAAAADAATSTSEIPLGRIAVNRPIKGKEIIQVESSTLRGLKKFSADFTHANYSIRANHSENQQAINEVYDFYLCMVLAHLRLEDYVESFLNDKVSWIHIVGLALAFNDYKHSAGSDGCTQMNGEFLTEALLLYYRKSDTLLLQTSTDYSRSLEHACKQLSEAQTEQAKLTAENQRLMRKIIPLETELQRLTSQNNNGQ